MLNKDSSSTLCDVCRSISSTIFCRADLAYLCATCDEVVHSANPLAGSHHRVPVIPTSDLKYEHQDTADMSMVGSVFESQGGILFQDSKDAMDNEDEEDEAGSWVLFDKENENGETNGFLFNGDDYLDLVEYNSSQDSRFSDDHRCHDLQFDIRQTSYGGGGDFMVPVKCEEGKKHHQVHRNPEMARENESSNGGYGFSSVQIPVMEDRKARVLRYMEKKKRRTFEKTIRYASRKAYAETRPRIKGRFAKRTNVGVEMEEMFSTTYCINVSSYM